MLSLRRAERARVAVFLKLTWEAAVLGRHGWSARRRAAHLIQALQSLSPLLFLTAIVAVFVTSPPDPLWVAAGFAFGTCGLCWLGIGVYYHRCVAHGALRVRRVWLKRFFELMGMLGFQEHPVLWAHYHRKHHQTSDTPDDLHSPWHSSFLWIFTFFRLYSGSMPASEFRKVRLEFPEETAGLTQRQFEARVDRYLFAVAGLHLVLFCAFMAFGGWRAVACFQLLPVLTVQSELFVLVHYASHRHGYRAYPNQGQDQSCNNVLAGIFVSEWHQNHHRNPGACRTGLRWWEFDPVYAVIAALARLGWVTDLVLPR